MKKLYDVIYCDPPWEYDNKNVGKTGQSGSNAKYKTLTTVDLLSLKVPSKSNSILFLWTTSPFLEDAFKLIHVWGFQYKTILIWDKVNMGMGYWFRGQTEYLLVAIKGIIKPFKCQIRNIYSEKSKKHSRKPAYYRKLIEMVCSNYPDKLEMFARSGRREG